MSVCVNALGEALCLGTLEAGALLAGVLIFGGTGGYVVVTRGFAMARHLIYSFALKHALVTVLVGVVGLEALSPSTVVPLLGDALDALLGLQ